MVSNKITIFLIMVFAFILIRGSNVFAVDYSYVAGTQDPVSLDEGTYIIEVWGSQGPSGSDWGLGHPDYYGYGGAGGLGGYAKGTLTLASPATIYINGSSGTIEVRKDADNTVNKILAGGVGGSGENGYQDPEPGYENYGVDGASGVNGIGYVYGYAPLTETSTITGARTGVGFTRITASLTTIISASSNTFANIGPVTYTVTYVGAGTVLLRDQDITLNKTGTADGVVTVTNGTTNTPTVTISGITGEGTLGISVAASRAWDATPNYAPAAGPSTTFTVDNTTPEVPTIDVSPSTSTNTDVIVTITYPGDASTKEYKIGAESWTSYTVAVTITINSTVYARCYDNAGNPSTQSSISIVNIDKTAPSAPIVDITTGTYSVAQTVTVIDPGAVDVAHTYYTLDGTEPDNTDTEVIGTMLVDGASVTVMLKLVSYDNAGNKGAITTEEYTFTDGPTITVDITGRIKDESDINVEIIVAAESGIDSWEYEWSENTTPTGSWISGVTDTQTLTQTANGIWYLHIRATDNDTNVVTVRYGIYKKGVVQVIEGYIEGTEKQDRKNFRYYIGKDNNGINKIMLVAGNHGGSVAQTLEKDDVLDINNKFRTGVFYIDREGKIQQY